MKKLSIAMLLVGLLSAKTTFQSAAAEPFSPRSNAAVQGQQTPAPTQTAPSASPYIKQPTQPTPAPGAPVQALSPAAPVMKQPSQQGPAVTRRKGEEAKLVSVQSGPVQLISWGYLRGNEPQTVERMLGEVSTGRLPRAAISGVVHPAQVDTLLKITEQRVQGASDSRRLPTGAVTQQSPAQAAKTPPSSTIALLPAALRSLPIQTAPNTIEFGTLMLGHAQNKTVRFIAPQTGNVSVSISDPAFQIRRLRSLKGTFTMRTVQMALPEGTRIHAVQQAIDMSQHRREPPWAIYARSGEDVEITLGLSRDPTVALGDHVGQLRIELANGTGAVVPVHARFDGPGNYGVDAIPDDERFRVLPGKSNLLRFKWVNNREPSEATLTLENLPVGFTTPTPVRTVKLGKGEVREDVFIVHVDEALQKMGNEFTKFELKLVNGPNRWIYTVDVEIVPPWFYQWYGARAQFSDGEVVSSQSRLQIRSDGWFQFDGRISGNTDPRVTLYNYVVGISLPGGFGHTVHGSFGRAVLLERTATGQGTWLESGMNSHLMVNFTINYAGLGKAQPSMKVTRY